ncbi:MAG TPA: hypothetical protein VG347_04240 [Verrucomicrobiae bacterium]|nr:hypothetical protein [Verrucomicrobiae bacterium]
MNKETKKQAAELAADYPFLSKWTLGLIQAGVVTPKAQLWAALQGDEAIYTN